MKTMTECPACCGDGVLEKGLALEIEDEATQIFDLRAKLAAANALIDKCNADCLDYMRERDEARAQLTASQQALAVLRRVMSAYGEIMRCPNLQADIARELETP